MVKILPNPDLDRIDAAYIETQARFNKVIDQEPLKAIAIALLGICHAVTAHARWYYTDFPEDTDAPEDN